MSGDTGIHPLERKGVVVFKHARAGAFARGATHLNHFLVEISGVSAKPRIGQARGRAL